MLVYAALKFNVSNEKSNKIKLSLSGFIFTNVAYFSLVKLLSTIILENLIYSVDCSH
jgi:hypothetical protein